MIHPDINAFKTTVNPGQGVDPVKVSGKTHVGKVRENNEDCFLIRRFPGKGALLAVSDGMGGEAAGEVAAQMTVDVLAEFTPDKSPLDGQLAALAGRADRAIIKYAEKTPGCQGMGATLTAVYVDGSAARYVQVGDSRLYRLRQGLLSQITVDQNLAQVLVEAGEISPRQARGHRLASLLEQCVGCGEVEAVTGDLMVQPGDVVMLCTDGLHGLVRTREIKACLSGPEDVDRKVDALIEAALAQGGTDNITVVAVQL